jgi:adenylyl-sulfate kinase
MPLAYLDLFRGQGSLGGQPVCDTGTQANQKEYDMDCAVKKESVSLLKSQSNIFPHGSQISRQQRNQRFGHQSGVVWLTGLSGSGKSTVATGVEQLLFKYGYLVSILDGDTVRAGLNTDLDFSFEGRQENLRRVAEVASIFASTGHIVISTLISPQQQTRDFVKQIVNHNFHTVYIRADIDDCIERDPKGLYKKAMAGGIENFTGIGQSYEEPVNPELVIDTSNHNIDACQMMLKDYIIEHFCLK